MKKFLALLVLLAGVAGGALYFKNDLSILLVTNDNDYKMVAKQFWVNRKDEIDSGKESRLPLKNNVKEIDFSLGEAQLQDGKYYFETTLYINRTAALPIYTVVEPVDGNWRVNVTETFLTTTSASLNRFTQRYADAMMLAEKFVIQDSLHGKAGEASLDQVQDIETFIDEQFSEAKERFKEQYLASVGLTISH